MHKHYLYDEHKVRYNLLATNGDQPYNWLFLPGGPGVGADYFNLLVHKISFPGNVWLLDLPGNGDYQQEDLPSFNEWDDIFIKSIKQFSNPILVGHSFGGMYPLLFPELENVLKGLVILNSAPSLWLEAAARVAKERNLPSLDAELAAMQDNPNENAIAALEACAPYYFKEENLEAGRALLRTLKFNPHAANWWFQRVATEGFDARWVPQNIETLIVGGEYDSITPFSIYENDKRFKRDNITLKLIENSGHVPWFDEPDAISSLFDAYIKQFNSAN